MAACSIANIVKSSLGPVGLDKMLVDDIGVCIVLNVQFKVEPTHRICVTNLYYII
jgi:chaperonin GroEL (HSP60 family)